MSAVASHSSLGQQLARAIGPEPAVALAAPWHFANTGAMTRLLAGKGAVTSVELNSAAGLGWTVRQTPAYVYLADPADPQVDAVGRVVAGRLDGFHLVGRRRVGGEDVVPALHLNIRDDTHQVVGVVKGRYRLVQNADAAAPLDQLVSAGQVVYAAAGALHGGAQVWWIAELTDHVEVAGDPRECIQTYLLLFNSHDGSIATSVAALPVRVSSQTVLTWPVPNTPRSIQLRHTDSTQGHLAASGDQAIGMARSYQSALVLVAERMVHTAIADDQFVAFLDRLLPTPKPKLSNGRVMNQRGITMAENTKGTITQIYYNNPTQEHLRGTLWGTVLACSYYADHMSISRTTDLSPEENRFIRLTSGVVATLGSRAFGQALGLLSTAR